MCTVNKRRRYVRSFSVRFVEPAIWFVVLQRSCIAISFGVIHCITTFTAVLLYSPAWQTPRRWWFIASLTYSETNDKLCSETRLSLPHSFSLRSRLWCLCFPVHVRIMRQSSLLRANGWWSLTQDKRLQARFVRALLKMALPCLRSKATYPFKTFLSKKPNLFFLSESFFSVVLERSTGTSGRVLSLLPFEATLDDYIGTLLKNKNAN